MNNLFSNTRTKACVSRCTISIFLPIDHILFSLWILLIWDLIWILLSSFRDTRDSKTNFSRKGTTIRINPRSVCDTLAIWRAIFSYFPSVFSIVTRCKIVSDTRASSLWNSKVVALATSVSEGKKIGRRNGNESFLFCSQEFFFLITEICHLQYLDLDSCNFIQRCIRVSWKQTYLFSLVYVLKTRIKPWNWIEQQSNAGLSIYSSEVSMTDFSIKIKFAFERFRWNKFRGKWYFKKRTKHRWWINYYKNNK